MTSEVYSLWVYTLHFYIRDIFTITFQLNISTTQASLLRRCVGNAPHRTMAECVPSHTTALKIRLSLANEMKRRGLISMAEKLLLISLPGPLRAACIVRLWDAAHRGAPKHVLIIQDLTHKARIEVYFAWPTISDQGSLCDFKS